LTDGGVYLITGGLGGIGLSLAEYLAQTVHAKLILVGRSSFPDRDKWEQWLVSHDEGDPVSHKIRKLKSLEALGAEVLVVTADVADLEQMKSAIQQAKKRFGTLRGVIHCAGIAGGGVIQLKDPRTAANVLSPKLKGTLVLDELLRDTTLDFFVLCSSVLGLTSQVGQVDYSAANAFLDAFAHYKTSKGNSVTVSIDWDGWEEVGMAVDNSLPSQAGSIHSASLGREINHPLLDRLVLETPDHFVYRTDFRVDRHWILNEHRILGTAALPGTAYLEMARAAYNDCFNRERIEITDVYFLTPVTVSESEQKQVFTVLERDGEVWDFRIVSNASLNGAGPSVWLEHARGTIADLPRSAAGVLVNQENFGRFDKRAVVLNAQEQASGRESMVYWGPRWQCVKALSLGKNEAFARLDLPGEFSGDLEKLQLHPSLLDVATSLAVSFLSQDQYIPFSYGRLEVHGPLSGKLNSHVKFDGSRLSGSETVTFDAVITDQNGKLLVQICGVSLKRVDDRMRLRNADGNLERELRPDPARLSEADAQFYESLLGVGIQPRKKLDRILPWEGVAAFRRILALGIAPQVVVSVADLHAVLDQRGPMVPAPFTEQASPQPSAGAAHARPHLESEYAAPQKDSEIALASIWQEVLGIERVGVNDNFFELGGDSVIAIQMIAKAKKAGFQLAPAQIFQHQTIAALAAIGEGDRRQEVVTTDSNLHSESSQVDDFGWTQGELDDIGRALRKSLN
jgi:polyketide synthase PksJ